jgi:hypothetical protein
MLLVLGLLVAVTIPFWRAVLRERSRQQDDAEREVAPERDPST